MPTSIVALHIVPSTEESPARPDWQRNSINWTGTEALPNMSVDFEGKNEPLAARFEWALRRPVSITAQPETIFFETDGEMRTHVPDFLVRTAEGDETRLEVKGAVAFAKDPTLWTKLETISTAYRQLGMTYEVATAHMLLNGPLATNVNDVFLARRSPRHDLIDHILDQIGHGQAHFGALTDNLVPIVGSEYQARHCLLNMHAEGRLTIDLCNGVIARSTKVRPGVHRLPLPWRKFDER